VLKTTLFRVPGVLLGRLLLACFIQSVAKSLNESRKFSHLRPPLCEVSPNKRSRICGKRDSGIRFSVIARGEDLTDATCQSIVKSAPKQASCLSRPRSGRPTVLPPGDQRLIFRTIVLQSKITAAQLVAQAVPHSSKKTVYCFLKKSSTQKWRCKKRPFLTPEHAAKRLK
jgi:hypothetical protein